MYDSHFYSGLLIRHRCTGPVSPLELAEPKAPLAAVCIRGSGERKKAERTGVSGPVFKEKKTIRGL